MGVKGLLAALASITRRVSLTKYANLTVAIDGYVWLHRATFSCAKELCTGAPTNKYLTTCMNLVHHLQRMKIKPFIVFDGNNLPAKRGEETKRRLNREEHLKEAMELLRQNNFVDANKEFQLAVNVSPTMAYNWIQILKKEGIPYLVAPYEADAQLAYLSLNGLVDAVLTEDSDLIAYGATKVLFKLDTTDFTCDEFLLEDLGSVKGMNMKDFSMSMLRHTCLLSGCDYIEGVKGYGIKKAHLLVRNAKGNANEIFRRLQLENNLPEDYEQRFQMADLTYQHQRVYNPNTKSITFLRDVPHDVDVSDWDFLGEQVPDDVAVAIAEAELHPSTKQPYVALKAFTAGPAASSPAPRLTASSSSVVSTYSATKDFQMFTKSIARRSTGIGLSAKAPLPQPGVSPITSFFSKQSPRSSGSSSDAETVSSCSSGPSLSPGDDIVDKTVQAEEGIATASTADISAPKPKPRVLAPDTPSPLKRELKARKSTGPLLVERSPTTTRLVSRFFANPNTPVIDLDADGEVTSMPTVTVSAYPQPAVNSTPLRASPTQELPSLGRVPLTQSSPASFTPILIPDDDEEDSTTGATVVRSLFTNRLNNTTSKVASWRDSSESIPSALAAVRELSPGPGPNRLMDRSPLPQGQILNLPGARDPDPALSAAPSFPRKTLSLFGPKRKEFPGKDEALSPPKRIKL